MSRWQKRARLVVAVLGLLVVVLVVVSVRKGQGTAPTEPVPRIDPKAVSQSSGGRLTQATGARIPGIVDFEHALAYADGSTRLIKPKITADRSGRQFVITSNEARVPHDQSNVAMEGDVQLAASDGLKAATEQASFSRGEGILRAPGKVSFSKGTLSGTSVGMTYDQERDVLWLLDQAAIDVAPSKDTGQGAKITAGTAGYARRDKYMRFDRGVRLLREGRTVESDSAVAYLTDDDSRLRAMELRGSSRIITNDAVQGGLQRMASRDMNLTYAEDGETLQHALLSGTASIQMAGSGGTPGRTIAGEYVDISFGPTGEVTALNARDRVQLTIPAQQDAPPRIIRAASMEGSGAEGQGLTAARFLDGVEFREQHAPDQTRIARSRTLEVAMQPGSGEIDEARFLGATRFEDGALRASAVNGTYRIAKGLLELTGSEAGRDPQVVDERITVDAKRIDLTFDGPKMVATGEVRSVLQPEKREAGGTAVAANPAEGGSRDRAGAAATPAGSREQKPVAAATPATAGSASNAAASGQHTVPGMLKDDQPVNVTGAALNYDGATSLATYTGGSRLWQGDTTIQGETIVIDENSGDLKASGGVRSAFVLEQEDEQTKERKKVPSIATGETLHYEDALNRATYTTNAHVNGPPGDCHADKIELYFAEGQSSLDRAEAYTNVKLTADNRTANGARMTYFAAGEKYLMSGAPVTILEIEECRVTTGKTLTFWRSTDRILVDGNEEIRTLTKKGGTCSEQPRDE
jgi:LPS export ABC transporter protein LptC